jgi:phosphomannomutase
VVVEKGQISMALDGDGDRIIFVDRKGRSMEVHPVICGLHLLSEEAEKRTLVTTVMSNAGVDRA